MRAVYLAACLLVAQHTQLWEAAKNGDLAAVQRGLDQGADPNVRGGEYQQPALHVAAAEGHAAIVEALAAKGASPNARDKLGYPALVVATFSRGSHAAAVIRALLRLGADPNLAGSDGKPAPQIAAEIGAMDKLEAMVSPSVSVDWKTRHQETLLAIAAGAGQAKAVHFLLEGGADVNAPDDEGFTPLMNACQNRHAEVVKLLLAKGADRAARSRYGDTALSLVQGKHDDTQAGRIRRTIAELLATKP